MMDSKKALRICQEITVTVIPWQAINQKDSDGH